VLRHGLLGTVGLYLASQGAGRLAAQQVPGTPRTGKAKAVIQIWLWGGPPHLDTFDPKPAAGNDYCGPLTSPLATNVKGIVICELLPQLAKQADKYSIIRSMTHGNNGHETAAYLVQTGRNPSDRVVHPTAGAVVSLFKGKGNGNLGLLPPYMVLTQPQGRFSEAGFLGSNYKPFATGGDPNGARFVVEGLFGQATEEQIRDRRALLQRMGSLPRAVPGNPTLQALTRTEDEAYDLLLGDASKLFDLGQEKNDLRQRYGRTALGQSCLTARRLVQRGVPYITINFGG